MPKRSERKEYAEKFTEGNPYADTSAEHLYKELRWGNGPTDTYEIDGPEDMATMGIVAKLVLTDVPRTVKFKEKDGPYLAVGLQSNYLYIVNRYDDGTPCNIQTDTEEYKCIGNIKQIDYFSDKNKEKAYYYHKHEKPYPFLYMSPDLMSCIVIPAELDSGHPSYIVREEGIIG
jgi:hypothetical protein